MVKMTFSLDEGTAGRLRETARRLAKPQSLVVREAINGYADSLGKLTEDERLEFLETFDRVVPRIPGRPVEDVDAEIEAVRRARRTAARRRSRS